MSQQLRADWQRLPGTPHDVHRQEARHGRRSGSVRSGVAEGSVPDLAPDAGFGVQQQRAVAGDPKAPVLSSCRWMRWRLRRSLVSSESRIPAFEQNLSAGRYVFEVVAAT